MGERAITDKSQALQRVKLYQDKFTITYIFTVKESSTTLTEKRLINVTEMYMKKYTDILWLSIRLAHSTTLLH